jgi:hypothetical protein
MINLTNEAELMAEHQAQAEAALRAEEAARRAAEEKASEEWRAERAAERAASNARVEKHLKQIKQHLPTAMNVIISDGCITIDGIRPQWEFKERYTSSTWRSRPTGTYQFTVGDWGDRKVFPQRKDGTFSYAKLAEQMLHQVQVVKVRQELRDAQENNKLFAAAIREEFGIDHWSSMVTPSQADQKPIHLRVSINRAVTTERAREILTILATIPEFGIKKGEI